MYVSGRDAMAAGGRLRPTAEPSVVQQVRVEVPLLVRGLGPSDCSGSYVLHLLIV